MKKKKKKKKIYYAKPEVLINVSPKTTEYEIGEAMHRIRLDGGKIQRHDMSRV